MNVEPKVWVQTLTLKLNPYRKGCKRCVKLAPRYDDPITRLGQLVDGD